MTSAKGPTDIGLFYFATEYGMPVVDVAREAERRGFESLWLPEHSHIPTSRKSPYIGGAELPKEYAHTLDPFVALSAAAAVTERIRFGTGISLLIERDTIMTAKSVATLDVISNGRFEFGLGGGWNREEAENHGTIWPTRFKRLEEQIEAMQKIWTEEEAEYHGRFVDFDPIWCWPKPVQSPHPPILIGGETIHTLRRIVRLADGWIPRARNPEPVFEGIETLKKLADEAGRDPQTISVSVFAPQPDPELIDKLINAGIRRLILWLPAEEEERTLKRLDRYEGFLSA
jgi:probable F420-dependent oxidoreductase